MSYEIIIQALWLVLPAYIANASALLIGGRIPIDFGKKWKDGKRILGNGKTWRGLIGGAFVGMIGGFGLSIVANYVNRSDFSFLALDDFTSFPLMIPIIGSICFGALFGDIIKSFFKRRAGIKRGDDWIPFDQIDFVLGVLLFSFLMASLLNFLDITSENWFFESFTLWHVLILLIITPFLHLFTNYVHKKIKSKQFDK